MSPDDLVRMFRDFPLQDNPPGAMRPDEDLIQVVTSKLAPVGKALDLSNDDGINSLFLAQSRYSVALLGMFTDEVELAKRRMEETGAGVSVFVSEPTSLPFHDQEFDLVYDPRLSEGLKGEERERFIHEVHRVLRPGGVFLVLIHNYKDQPEGCFTRQSVDMLFHPLFETMRVLDRNSVERRHALRTYYQVLLRRP